jgi:hypothetical protein
VDQDDSCLYEVIRLSPVTLHASHNNLPDFLEFIVIFQRPTGRLWAYRVAPTRT